MPMSPLTIIDDGLKSSILASSHGYYLWCERIYQAALTSLNHLVIVASHQHIFTELMYCNKQILEFSAINHVI